MGQGTLTAMPLCLAEDMDADWSKVSAAIPAAADPLFGSDVGARYRDLHTQIMRENQSIN